MANLSAAQIKQLAVNSGFQGQSADTITGIALAESSGNPNAIAFNDGGKGFNSYGLTQINGVHPGAAAALDPQTSLDKAFQISKGGTDFTPWSTYNSGAYKQFVSDGGGGPAMSIDAPSDFTDPGTTLGNASGDFGGGNDNAVASDSSNAGSGTVVDPNTGIATLAAGPGNTGGGGVYNPAALENAGKAPAVKNSSAIPDVADAIKIGFGSIGDNVAASVSKAITSAEAYLQRFGVMILAIVLFIVAAWFMMPSGTKNSIIGTVAKAA